MSSSPRLWSKQGEDEVDKELQGEESGVGLKGEDRGEEEEDKGEVAEETTLDSPKSL